MNNYKIKLLFPFLLLFIFAACGNNEDVALDHTDTISSLQTEISSDQFPHTKPIKIQEAKYEYRVEFGAQSNPPEGSLKQQQNGTRQQTEAPKQQQTEQNQQAQQNQQQAQKQAAPESKQPAKGAGTVSEIEKQVIELTNAQRRKNGLPNLKLDTSLSNVAREKSNDMQKNNYFSHTSPTYGSPFDMMRDFGITYKAAGENIAKGQPTAEQVVDAWMNSEGHRRNILSGNFTHIGVGYNQTEHHWTQMFISK